MFLLVTDWVPEISRKMGLMQVEQGFFSSHFWQIW